MTETYESACIRHARAQGLEPALMGLTRALSRPDSPYTVGLAQTGGWVMLVEVRMPGIGRSDFCYVSYDGEDEEAPWVVGHYASPEEDSTEEYRYCSESAIPEVVLHLFHTYQKEHLECK